jgi:serine/threonine-protein kinase HipA
MIVKYFHRFCKTCFINPEDKEELALTLEGKKNKLKREHFERLGEGLGLNPKQIQGVFTRIEGNRVRANHWIRQSFLSLEMQETYLGIMNDRYERLEIP